MKKAKLISMALTVLMAVSAFTAMPVSANNATWSEDFETELTWTAKEMVNYQTFSLNQVDGFTSKAASDTALRISHDDKSVAAGITLEKNFDTPIAIPENGVFRFGLEFAKQEHATEFAVHLKGKLADGTDVVAYSVFYSTGFLYYVNGAASSTAEVPTGKWYKFETEYNYDGSSRAFVNGRELAGTTQNKPLAAVTGVLIDCVTSKAPTAQGDYAAGEILPVEVLVDNISIEAAASAAELSAREYPYYLNSLNMTFNNINYKADAYTFRPYRSGTINTWAYIQASPINATTYDSRNADGVVRASYITPSGVFGKASTDSALKFFADAGMFSGTNNPYSDMVLNGIGSGLKSGDTAIISFSFAQENNEWPIINLFGNAVSTPNLIAPAGTSQSTFFFTDGNNKINVYHYATNKVVSPKKWYKMDFVITMGDTSCMIQPYVDGEKLMDAPIEAVYSSGACPSNLSMRLATIITANNGKECQATATYYDDICCAYFPAGSAIPNLEKAVTLDANSGMTLNGKTIYTNAGYVSVDALKSAVLTDGRSMRVIRNGEEVTSGSVATGDSVAVVTEYGGEVFYYIELPQKNVIQENTFDKLGYDSVIANNTAVPGWDLYKVGGNYTWASTNLTNDGAGGKSTDDNYFVMRADDLTREMVAALGSGIHIDPNMTTYHNVDYPVYTYEMSVYANPDAYCDANMIAFHNTSTVATPISYYWKNGDGFLTIRDYKGENAENIKTGMKAGRWYKLAVTIDSDGKADFYLNGDLIKADFDIFPGVAKGAIARWKLCMYSTWGDSYLAMDNIRWSGSDYANFNGGDVIEVSSTGAITVDEAGGRILIKGAAMAKNQLVKALDTDADIAVYTDNTFAEECSAAVAEGSVLTLTSANGEVIKYFDIVNQSNFPTEFGEVSTSTENGTATATVSFKSYKAQDAALVIATYNGTKLVSIDIDEADDVVGDKTLAASVAVGDGETVKTFFFDSLTTLKPIK